MSDTPYRWVPPDLDEDGVEAFLSVRGGIPHTARDALTAWLTEDKYGNELFSTTALIKFQTASGIDLGIGSRSGMSVLDARNMFQGLPENTLLYLLDFTLSQYWSRFDMGHFPLEVERLSEILYSAGSSWDVGLRQGRYGLVERIPSGVTHVVDQVLSRQDKASSMLRRAWDKAYGVSPSPSDAYHDAVKAVEILANPLISPKDSDATLGKDISVLRTQETKWQFVMAGSNHATAVEHVRSTMQLLWHSQSDRHGRHDYEDVSLEEAQAAVLLAATLVGWLSQGALKKVA